MGTTADKLNKLLETKAAIKQAIIDKGVDISDADTFASYPEKISAIEAGGEVGSDKWFDIFNLITNNNTDYSDLFSNYDGEQLDISVLDSSNVTNMSSMFNGCVNLISVDISTLDTHNVTNMSSMFSYNYKLKSIDVSHFNTSKTTTINAMFTSCKALTTLDCSNFDLTNCNIISGAFSNCTVLVDFYPPQNIKVDMTVSNSNALSHDSLVRIINNLMEITTTKTLTLGTTNLAKLSDEELAVATNKGWTLK